MLQRQLSKLISKSSKDINTLFTHFVFSEFCSVGHFFPWCHTWGELGLKVLALGALEVRGQNSLNRCQWFSPTSNYNVVDDDGCSCFPGDISFVVLMNSRVTDGSIST